MMQNNKEKVKEMSKNIVSSRKFKYGTSAMIFTAVFVAFVVLFNVLLSFVDVRTGGLYIDMTSKKLYGVSQASVEALKGVDKPVEIIFCQSADKINEDDILNPIKMLASSYEKQFDNVSVVYKDILSNPVYFNSFKKTSADVINSYSVIVNCPSTGLSTIYSWEDMYKYNTEGALFAFDGENKLTTAMLSLAKNDENMLKAGLITGHGESVNHEMQHYLEDYGYVVSNVDLKTISEKELSAYNLLLVCNPATDYIGIDEDDILSDAGRLDKTAAAEEAAAEVAADMGLEAQPEAQDLLGDGEVQELSENVLPELYTEQPAAPTPAAPVLGEKSVNEIEKLYNYVVEDFGNLVFFIDPYGRELPELLSLVGDGFGVEVDNVYTVVDASTLLRSSNSFDLGGMRFLGNYDVSDTTTGAYQLHKALSEAQTGYPPVFGVSCFMNIPKKTTGSFEISPIITGSENATVITEQGYIEAPYAPLMTLSRYSRIVDNNTKTANVIVCGSTGFISEIDNPSFANADLFKQILMTTGNDNIVSDIDFKVLDESSIEVTKADSDSMMKRLAVVVPVIIAILGIAMFIKRKYL